MFQSRYKGVAMLDEADFTHMFGEAVMLPAQPAHAHEEQRETSTPVAAVDVHALIEKGDVEALQAALQSQPDLSQAVCPRSQLTALHKVGGTKATKHCKNARTRSSYRGS